MLNNHPPSKVALWLPYQAVEFYTQNVAGQGNNLTVYVNGKQANPGTDFRKIPVNAYDEIVIIYGKPPDSIPSSYKFPEEL